MGMLGDFAKPYIVDLIVFSASWEDILKHLRIRNTAVLTRSRSDGKADEMPICYD